MKKKTILFILLAAVLAVAVCMSACVGKNAGNGGDKNPQEKVALRSDRLTFTQQGLTYEYTGSPIAPQKDIVVLEPNGNEPIESKGFTFTFSDNINVGTATATVTANSDNRYYYGSATINFPIVRGKLNVSDSEELAKILSEDNVYEVYVSGLNDVVLTGYDVTVKPHVKLYLREGYKDDYYSFYTGENFVNNGEIIIESAKYGYKGTRFYARGNFVNNGSIILGDNGRFYCGENVENPGKITCSNNNTKFFSCEEEVENVDVAQQIVRQRLAPEMITMGTQTKPITEIVYSENHENNKPEIMVNGRANVCACEYFDYDKAGTAYVNVTVREWDEEIFGSLKYEYEIKRAAADVTDVAELKELQSTGNYGTFNASEFTVAEGESLTLEEGVVLNATEIDVLGTLINRGTINCLRSSPEVYDGYFRLNRYDASALDYVGAGNFDNYGTVHAHSFSAMKNSGFANYGKLITDAEATFDEPVTNDANGEMEIGVPRFFADFENRGKITSPFGSGNVVKFATTKHITFKNFGTVKFDNEVLVDYDFTFEGNPIENTKTVWSNVENIEDYFTGEVVIKRHLQKEDLELVNPSVVYDGKSHSVEFTEESGLKTGDFEAKYCYADRYAILGEDGFKWTLPKDVGKILVQITVKKEATRYFFNDVAIVEFEITPAEIVVNKSSELSSALDNKNYGKFILNCDVTTSDRLIVREGTILDMNGRTLKMEYANYSSYLENQGTILNNMAVDFGTDYTPTMSDCGIIFTYNTAFHNKGIVENDNIIYLADGCKLVDGGTIVNRGRIYHGAGENFDNNIENAEGALDFSRESLNDLYKIERLKWEYATTVYDGTEKRPEISLTDVNGGAVELAEERFDILYERNTEASLILNARCLIKVKNDFDEEFSGQRDFSFYIEKGVLEVDNTADLKTNMENLNYKGFILRPRYSYSEFFDLTEDVIVRKDVFIDLGTLSINNNNSYNKEAKLIFNNNKEYGAELWVTVTNFAGLQDAVYYADKITLGNDITPDGTLTIYLPNKNNRYNDVVAKDFGGNSRTNVKTKTLDLNGHKINGKLTIKAYNFGNSEKSSLYYDYTYKITDSSESKTGVIGDGNGFGLELTTGNEGQYYFGLLLDGIKVRGGVTGNDKIRAYSANGCDLDYKGE